MKTKNTINVNESKIEKSNINKKKIVKSNNPNINIKIKEYNF